MRSLKARESLPCAESKPDIIRIGVILTAHKVSGTPKPPCDYFNKCPGKARTNQRHAKEMPPVHWPGHTTLHSKPSGKLWRFLNNAMQPSSYRCAWREGSSTHPSIHCAPGPVPVREHRAGEIYRVPASETHCPRTGGQTTPTQFSWAL